MHFFIASTFDARTCITSW